MSRVSTHAVKQASLDLKNMIDKKSVGLTVDEITEIVNLSSLTESVSKHCKTKVYGINDEKPEILQTTIDQIKGLFDVGKEITGWTVSYYGTPNKNSVTKKFTSSDLRIPSVGGLGGRFIVVIGSRDVANLEVSVASNTAESGIMLLDGDVLYIKITLAPVADIIFSNSGSAKLPPRKGFRETIVRKNPHNRHVLVFDAHIEMEDVVSHMTGKLMGNMKKKMDMIDESIQEEIPELVGE